MRAQTVVRRKNAVARTFTRGGGGSSGRHEQLLMSGGEHLIRVRGLTYTLRATAAGQTRVAVT